MRLMNSGGSVKRMKKNMKIKVMNKKMNFKNTTKHDGTVFVSTF